MKAACLAALVAVLPAFAGCASDGHLHFHSFDEALAAEHIVADAQTDTTLQLRVLAPLQTTGAARGHTDVTVLLLRPDGNGSYAPVTDATITLDATMPAMGHGTDDESDPVHDAYGVYSGHTDLMMDGQWRLEFEVRTATLDVFSLDVRVGS